MESEAAGIPVFGDVCVRKVRRKRQKKLLVLLFLDFAKNTTLHGLRYIAEKSLHIIEKLFWFATFFLCTFLCFYFIYDAWDQWQSSPVIVSFSAKHIPVSQVPFPAVTICPMAQVIQNKFNYTHVWKLAEENYTEYEKNNPETLRAAKILKILCDFKVLDENSNNITHLNSSDISLLDKLIEDFNLAILMCSWQNRDCPKLSKVLTKVGVCLNFNGLRAEDILSDNVQKDFKYSSSTNKIRNWSMDEGYTTEAHGDVYPYRGSGVIINMAFLLKDLDKLKDKQCNGLYAGYKIFLHHPADFPQAFLYSFAALANQNSQISIEFSMETANQTLKKYPIEIRQCYFQDDRPLTFFRIYTYTNCMLECLANFTVGICHCIPFYLPYNDSTIICSTDEYNCLLQAEWDFQGSVTENCRCLPLCNFISYDADVHKTEFNLALAVKENFDISHIGENQAKVELFYKQPMYKIVHRSELFGFTEFLANCGGLLGLFIGFSWISLVEIFYFLTFRVFKTIKNDLKTEKSNVSKKQFEVALRNMKD